MFDNWFKKHYPQKSLVICSPYVKKDALDKLISLYNIDERSEFDLKVLIRGNVGEFTYQKSSDISIFDSLLSIKKFDINNVKRVTNLHMKAYLVDERHLLITSGNLTNNGMFVISGKENFEGGISTNDPYIISQFIKYFSHIWKQGENLEDFYDELELAYITYIETEYSDKDTLQKITRKRYKFGKKTIFDESVIKDSQDENSDCEEIGLLNYLLRSDDETMGDIPKIQTFSLEDIPPVGTLVHLPSTLKIISEYEDGISYLDLGRKLRTIFSNSESTTDGANRKFGEEKGKFAAFLNFASIEDSNSGKLIKISKLGKTYLKMENEDRNKIIKDVFFDKSIVVSIMRHSIEDPDFDLLEFLVANCAGATRSTLQRKAGALRELFSYISAICTEEELQMILKNV
ncbi:MAG: hypothetical protein IJN37_09765 [Clostridia bacterium]|nr:hypothetical protein [Clostridia bacterium]